MQKALKLKLSKEEAMTILRSLDLLVEAQQLKDVDTRHTLALRDYVNAGLVFLWKAELKNE
jgi:hypothetical protein